MGNETRILTILYFDRFHLFSFLTKFFTIVYIEIFKKTNFEMKNSESEVRFKLDDNKKLQIRLFSIFVKNNYFLNNNFLFIF